jgi:ribosomal protein S18 acetylase RimI-like enzyme
MLAIRYASEPDIPTLIQMFGSVVSILDIYSEEARKGEIAKFSEQTFAARIKADRMAVSIAERDGVPVGFCITDDQKGPIWIDWYGALPQARSLGIGSALIQHLIDEMPARKATRIWCDTRTNNTASIGLFEKFGFRRLCRLDNHWYGQDFFLWEYTPASP